jgi:hypothetical protein
LDTATQLAPQNNQLMSKHRVLSLKPHLRLEWRGQDGQDETEKPDHSASLSDSITSSIRIGFSVNTGSGRQSSINDLELFGVLKISPLSGSSHDYFRHADGQDRVGKLPTP